MDIYREACQGTYPLKDGRAKRNVRYKSAVHNIEMDLIAAAIVQGPDVAPELREVCSKN